MRLTAASWIGPAIGTLLLAGLAFGAFDGAKRHVAQLRWTAAAPRASLAAPVNGPAIYAGVLRGPADRKSPMGSRAAAHWWWVDERQNKSVRTVCSGSAREGLELVDGAVAVPAPVLAALDAKPMGDGFRDAYDAPVILDVGSATGSADASAPPAALGKCAGTGRTYYERFIEPGTRVELLACHDGAALVACPGAPHAAILAIPTLAHHREERVQSSLLGMRGFALGGLVIVLYLFISTLVGEGSVLRGMRPARRQP